MQITYTVLFAKNVPHYGNVKISAAGDEDALAKAIAYWKRVELHEEPCPCTEIQDAALGQRIVAIFDEDGRTPWDGISLEADPAESNGAPIESVSVNASLEEIIRQANIGLTAAESEKQSSLDQILRIARAAPTSPTGGAA